MDYNGYRTKKSSINFRIRYPANDSLNHADESELQTLEFKSLTDFQKTTGYERHSITLPFEGTFENVTLPDSKRKGHVYPVEHFDFRLKSSSKAIDAGCVLPNVTDSYNGKAPDLGALEYGQQAIKYGPRQ